MYTMSFLQYISCSDLQIWQHYVCHAWMNFIAIALSMPSINAREANFPNFIIVNYASFLLPIQ